MFDKDSCTYDEHNFEEFSSRVFVLFELHDGGGEDERQCRGGIAVTGRWRGMRVGEREGERGRKSGGR